MIEAFKTKSARQQQMTTEEMHAILEERDSAVNKVQEWLTHPPLDKMVTILADAVFKCIYLNANDRIPITISLKLIPRSPIYNKPALVQVMAWRRTGDKPLPEPMLTRSTVAYMQHQEETS